MKVVDIRGRKDEEGNPPDDVIYIGSKYVIGHWNLKKSIFYCPYDKRYGKKGRILKYITHLYENFNDSDFVDSFVELRDSEKDLGDLCDPDISHGNVILYVLENIEEEENGELIFPAMDDVKNYFEENIEGETIPIGEPVTESNFDMSRVSSSRKSKYYNCKELKEICDIFNIGYKSKDTKLVLSNKIKEHFGIELEKETRSDEVTLDNVDREKIMKGRKKGSYTVPQLKKIAALLEIPNTSKLKKSELVDIILENLD